MIVGLLATLSTAFVCHDITSVSMSVAWATGSATPADLHLLLLSNGTAPAPAFLAQTSVMTEATVIDLLPETTYYFRARMHPASEATVAWGPGWVDVAGEGSCTTASSPVSCCMHR